MISCGYERIDAGHVGIKVNLYGTDKGYNTAAANYTAEQIYSDRKLFENDAEQAVVTILLKEGFTIENLVVINSIRLPEDIKKSIENKVEAKQIALMKESELQQTTADANKKIEEARGKAESMIVMAEAESKSYLLKQRSLTSILIQQQFVEKWDGVLPVYGQVPELFRTIQK